MTQTELETIIHQVASQSHLSSDDIPDLDLYIDQIITLFDQKLENNKRYEDDKLLTKTMVNNYSKAKVITPIKGKKYSKEQIISMLMIYQLKNSLTIQEIKQLLTPYYQENISLENIYNQFYQIQDKQQDELPQFIHQYLKDYQLPLNNQEDLLILVLSLASLNDQITRIIQLILDHLEESK
ncbi:MULTISPECIES: DUF1836 domain-containing protein [Coprobacillaceae]|uniref:DUF1836 domain-containing protein n=1 Tax=Coprobacillaceae TaxID=2810280 RepID=UPI000E4BA1F1|nr:MULTISPECIES: DUF1836 domain-containing protein [Coprobacillaceae]RHM62115.1 DUF1836 domain-containing protein [Coprobacillus sp. AF33-1AC]RHS95992.1 DUF1836 domain-containing protein [Erysipelatoclostridium sp. AM42-17]